jgi:hypothetical protein
MASTHRASSQRTISQEADEGVRSFLEGVRRLPGVQRVEVIGSRSPAEQSVVVYLSEGDLETERHIYGLEADTYQQYPHLRLDIWVQGIGAEQGTSRPAAPSG